MLFATILEQIQIQTEKFGYPVTVDYLDEDANEVDKALQICREVKPLGLIFLGGNIDYFKQGFQNIPIPSVLVTNSAVSVQHNKLSSVFTDDVAGAECAIDYLVAHGHKEIGIIGGKIETSFTSSLRLQGCMNSFEKNNLSFHGETQSQTARYSFESAYKAMNRLLGKMPNISAVFCMSDVMAIGAIRALLDRGLVVPEHISVMGYDGIELAEFYNPKIVTIRQIKSKLAQRSLEILLDYIENDAGAVHEVIPFELVEGESVRHMS